MNSLNIPICKYLFSDNKNLVVAVLSNIKILSFQMVIRCSVVGDVDVV